MSCSWGVAEESWVRFEKVKEGLEVSKVEVGERLCIVIGCWIVVFGLLIVVFGL